MFYHEIAPRRRRFTAAEVPRHVILPGQKAAFGRVLETDSMRQERQRQLQDEDHRDQNTLAFIGCPDTSMWGGVVFYQLQFGGLLIANVIVGIYLFLSTTADRSKVLIPERPNELPGPFDEIDTASYPGTTGLFAGMLVIQSLGMLAVQASFGLGIAMYIAAVPIWYVFALFYVRASIELLRFSLDLALVTLAWFILKRVSHTYTLSISTRFG